MNPETKKSIIAGMEGLLVSAPQSEKAAHLVDILRNNGESVTSADAPEVQNRRGQARRECPDTGNHTPSVR